MLKNNVFLTQTDTTIGFISQNPQKLSDIKKRPLSKHYIKAINSLQTLQQFTRIPQKHKKMIRRAKQTTFILPNAYSYRIIQNKHHLLLLDRLLWAYTTSANLSGQSYDETFAKRSADIQIAPLQISQKASRILKLGAKKIQRIR